MRRVEVIDDLAKVQHAIISVYDKSGLENFIPELIDILPEIVIYSTGGTLRHIKTILGSESEQVRDVSEYIEQKPTEGGLVKTLDFKLFLGYLTETYSQSHQEDLKKRVLYLSTLQSLTYTRLLNLLHVKGLTLRMRE